MKVFFRMSALGDFAVRRRASVLLSLFDKVARLWACKFIVERLQRGCFPVGIAKFLRAGFLWNTWWLLLNYLHCKSCVF